MVFSSKGKGRLQSVRWTQGHRRQRNGHDKSTVRRTRALRPHYVRCHAQEGNSRPQPVVQPLTIPLPADRPYPGTMQLKVDATDFARGISSRSPDDPGGEVGQADAALSRMAARQARPRGAIAEVAGFKASAGSNPSSGRASRPTSTRFDIDVPQARKASMSPSTSCRPPHERRSGRATSAMMNLQWDRSPVSRGLFHARDSGTA